MRLSFSSMLSANPRSLTVEMVERKGVGHPDTLSDAMSESISRSYSQYCRELFGRIPHHWFDKVMLIGGESDNRFGVGKLTKPYTVIVAGKCARSVGGTPIPVEEIARTACVQVLEQCLTGFDAEAHLVFDFRAVDYTGPGRTSSRYRPASKEELDEIGAPGLVSNDGNLVVGFAPQSALEQMVMFVETLLNGPQFKATNPDVGWDIKVFGTRFDQTTTLIVNVPFLASRIPSADEYLRRKADVAALLESALADSWPDRIPEVVLNPADGADQHYLVSLGSVADTGDVGVTGRGNRITGLITPMRPMSIEAPAGKNPLDHTGKILAVFAHELAQRIYVTIGVAVEVFVHIAKGTQISAPEQVAVASERALTERERVEVAALVAESLTQVSTISDRFVNPGIVTW